MQYLDRCLESVCLQTEQNIEIIIVDDASPDASWGLIQEYARRDSRIVPIRHEVNKHLGGARNTGIGTARGEWLLFVDSDDYIDRDTVRIISNYSKKYPNIELLQYKYFLVSSEGQISIGPENQNIKEDIIITNLFEHYTRWQYPFIWHSGCLNIWKRNFVVQNNLQFSENTSMEDFASFMQWIYQLQNPVLFMPKYLYYYQKHSTSITANFNKQVKSMIKFVHILDNWSTSLNKKFRDLAFQRISQEIRSWLYDSVDQKYGNYFLRNIPIRYAVKQFYQAQEEALSNWHALELTRTEIQKFQVEKNNLQQDRWYRFGQLSRKRKIWVIGKTLSKKFMIYSLLKPFAKIIKYMFEEKG